jgi:hypothetical protein
LEKLREEYFGVGGRKKNRRRRLDIEISIKGDDVMRRIDFVDRSYDETVLLLREFREEVIK